MVVVRNTSNRELFIKELRKTIPVCNNNYVIPDKVYEKYKNQLSLVSITLSETEIKKVFNTDGVSSGKTDTTSNDSYLYEIVMVEGVEYTIAPSYN